MQQINNRRFLILSIKLAIAGIVLAVVFHKIPLQDVASTLAGAEVMYLAAALGAACLAQVVMARRLQRVTRVQGFQLRFRRALAINLSATFYRLFLPGGNLTSGAVRTYQLSHLDGRIGASAAAVVYDRLDATVTVVLVGIICELWDASHSHETALLLMLICFGAVLVLYRFLFLPGPAMGGRIGALIRDKVAKRSEGWLGPYQEMLWSARARISLTSLVGHVVGIVLLFFLAISLDVRVSPIALGWIRTTVLLVTMLPITVSGLGVREGAFAFLLLPYGVQGEQAVALSLLMFALSHVVPGIAGGVVEGQRLLRGSLEGPV